MLKDAFISLLQKYSKDHLLIHRLWGEIESNYCNKKRHYHTLNHLENLFIQLEGIKSEIKDWDTVLFAVFYHDVIYKSTKKDNEEKSAELAVNRLKEINYPAGKMELCVAHIIATKSHSTSTNTDTNYFTDADLSILGSAQNIYLEYVKKIRLEYSIYPDLMYNPGRKKVLQHFLEMEYIFKTEYFRNAFEKQARLNITVELENM